jgi:hypothetical protein
MNSRANNNSKVNNNFKRNNELRKSLLKKCGLPDGQQTSHCFNDATHHTCCLLGKEARNYADSTGNPIGKLSESIQSGDKSGNKHRNKSKKVVPWCTCTGSKVCSFYSQKFGKSDDTHIKFIGRLKPKKTKKTTKNNSNEKWNENNAIDRLKLLQHKTPGVI